MNTTLEVDSQPRIKVSVGSGLEFFWKFGQMIVKHALKSKTIA